jgi:hypothetical protein
MRALRDQHHRLAATAEPRTKSAGPFPPERPLGRRRAVSHRVPTTYTVWPDECDAIVQVAAQLGVNLSQLVTDALVLRYDIDLGGTTTPERR